MMVLQCSSALAPWVPMLRGPVPGFAGAFSGQGSASGPQPMGTPNPVTTTVSFVIIWSSYPLKVTSQVNNHSQTYHHLSILSFVIAMVKLRCDLFVSVRLSPRRWTHENERVLNQRLTHNCRERWIIGRLIDLIDRFTSFTPLWSNIIGDPLDIKNCHRPHWS